MSDLDTRNKRASGLGIDLPWLRVYPNPDGTLSQADWQQIALKYSGIIARDPLTRNTRASMIGLDFAWLHIYPNPDGAFSVADRQQTGYKYGNISSSSGGGGVINRLLLLGVG